MASKTIDHMDLYVPIAPYKHETASDQTFDSLRVYVSYRKGSGFEVGYHPGWGDGAMWGCLFDFSKNPLTAGQEVLAKAATKNSVKELQAMYDSLNQGTARKIIALLFDHRKWPILLESLRHIALSSTWATEELLQSLTRQLTEGKPNEEESPMMKQFRDLKAKHPDAMLLFRCGDFYETYNEDAKECAKILSITLTNHKNGYQMAMFPHHALDTYLPRLIRAGKRVAICDQLEDPKLRKTVKRGITEIVNGNENETTNSKTQELKNLKTMATNVKAAELIGKTIVVVNNDKIKYVIKGVDGDKYVTDFIMEGRPAMPCPVPMEQLTKMVDAGTWKLAEGEQVQGSSGKPETGEAMNPETTSATEDVDAPKAKTAKPKAKKSEAKAENLNTEGIASGTRERSGKPETSASGKLRYSTYKNKKGKQCAKITGFGENDPAYANCADLHGSASYERDKKGDKSFYLVFGPRYVDAAKEVCDALNAGKAFADCKAIIDAATEERAKQREEWKQKREERKACSDEQVPGSKVYTEAEVADLLKRVIAGDKEAMEIVNAMSKAA